MSVYALLYRSRARVPLSDSDALQIAKSSARRNARVDITGLLLFSEISSGNSLFVQWLEGSHDEVKSLYEQICSDDRHVNCEVIAEGTTEDLVGRDGRLFPHWEMGYREVGDLPVTLEAFLDQWLFRRPAS